MRGFLCIHYQVEEIKLRYASSESSICFTWEYSDLYPSMTDDGNYSFSYQHFDTNSTGVQDMFYITI